MTEPAPKSEPKPQAIVIVGDFDCGFRFIGPFLSADAARKYAGSNESVVTLTPGDNRAALAMMACHMLIYGADGIEPGTDACLQRTIDLARMATA